MKNTIIFLKERIYITIQRSRPWLVLTLAITGKLATLPKNN